MPTAAIPIAVAADDVMAVGTGPTHPPAYTNHAPTTDTTLEASRNFEGGTTYVVRNALMRFDTSQIPDAATVTNAKLIGYLAAVDTDDARSISAEYYTWNSSSSDYNATGTLVGPQAFVFDISIFSPGHWRLPLLTPGTNINKSGYTSLRWSVPGAAPSGFNYFVFASSSNVTRSKPLLTALYSPAATPPTGPGTWRHEFEVPADVDDQEIGQFNSTVWPPNTSIDRRTDFIFQRVSKGRNNANTAYEARIALLNFDTSSIPDGATINSAKLWLYIYFAANVDNRTLVGDYTAWTGSSTADFSLNVGSTAFSTNLSTFTATAPGWFDITLTNPATNIDKTGSTKLRIGVGGTATPTGENAVEFSSLPNTDVEPPAHLEVNYTVAGGSTATFLGGVVG